MKQDTRHYREWTANVERKGFKIMMDIPDRRPWHPQGLPKDQWWSRASSLSQVSEVLWENKICINGTQYIYSYISIHVSMYLDIYFIHSLMWCVIGCKLVSVMWQFSFTLFFIQSSQHYVKWNICPTDNCMCQLRKFDKSKVRRL